MDFDVHDQDFMIDYALNLVDLGFSIIPLNPKSKVPLKGVSISEFQYRKPSFNEVRKWFMQNENINIGIMCGEISNLLVLDIDSEELMGKYKEFIEETPTLKVKTGKGMHLYFRGKNQKTIHPKDVKLDIQGNGAYVVAPPSIHPNGMKYEWCGDQDIEEDDILPVPDWVEQIIMTYEKEAVNKPDNWMNELISGVAEGRRITSLAELAGYLFGKGIDKSIVEDICKLWNKENMPSLKLPELKKTINSIYERHLNNPADMRSEVERMILFKNKFKDRLSEEEVEETLNMFIHNKEATEKVKIEISDVIDRINLELTTKIIVIKKVLSLSGDPCYIFHCINENGLVPDGVYKFQLTAQELINFKPFQAQMLNAGYKVIHKRPKKWLAMVDLMMQSVLIENQDIEETFEGTVAIYVKTFLNEHGIVFLGGELGKCMYNERNIYVNPDELTQYAAMRFDAKFKRAEIIKSLKALGFKKEKLNIENSSYVFWVSDYTNFNARMAVVEKQNGVV